MSLDKLIMLREEKQGRYKKILASLTPEELNTERDKICNALDIEIDSFIPLFKFNILIEKYKIVLIDWKARKINNLLANKLKVYGIPPPFIYVEASGNWVTKNREINISLDNKQEYLIIKYRDIEDIREKRKGNMRAKI